jgi:hypothetical protein
MQRFDCNSRACVSARAAASDPTKTVVSINFYHEVQHKPYYDVSMPARATQIIRENMGHCRPVDLVPIIQAEFPNITAAQIYAAWIKLSEEIWKRADNQIESAMQLLQELGDEVEIERTKLDDGVEQLCWTMKKIAGTLGKGVVEIALDATCKLK